MIKKINILFLSMFGLGYSKYAPGTVASFITSLIFIFFYNYQINIFFLILCTSLIFIYSVYIIDIYKSFFDEIDSKEIVIDEFVGQSIPILTIYGLLQKNDIDNFLLYTLLSFFLFRLFDILKPYPINKIDEKMKNGFGVMLDDVMAGVFSSIVILIIILYVQYD
jgi:phosphatidylglycerophosphatase A|tara:strand:+ start:752 stop:1246 length:495 start_codon:yes stop_codon:yes gene_type:complete